MSPVADDKCVQQVRSVSVCASTISRTGEMGAQGERTASGCERSSAVGRAEGGLWCGGCHDVATVLDDAAVTVDAGATVFDVATGRIGFAAV
mmetsp:Transcript_45834/g.93804  ORF Transcript_45834/g.93804 Transcript_45834/m.93804 type:complete len:92 (-) Transcript_45834:260-535(-)